MAVARARIARTELNVRKAVFVVELFMSVDFVKLR